MQKQASNGQGTLPLPFLGSLKLTTKYVKLEILY